MRSLSKISEINLTTITLLAIIHSIRPVTWLGGESKHLVIRVGEIYCECGRFK